MKNTTKNTNVAQMINMKNGKKKLAAIVALVTSARTIYDNEDVEIKAPTVCTTEGRGSIKYLDDASKAALATQELKTIIQEVECIEGTIVGINTNKKFTELVATNPLLCNLEITSGLGLA